MNGNRLRWKFEKRWGRWRRFASYYPLTANGITAVVSFVIGLIIT